MGAAQSSRDEVRRNLKLEFILAQARGLEGEALFDHMAAVTEAKLVGRSRPPSQMSQKSRTPRSRASRAALRQARPPRFGRTHNGKIQGLAMSVNMCGSGFGPPIISLALDRGARTYNVTE